MLILGIESSSLTASVALLQDDRQLAEYTIDYKKTHSQTLLPMIDEICKMTDTTPQQINVIAVSAGPGSFTGLRIGSATAKGLGLALKKPLVSVPTVAAMAYQCYGSRYVICPIMDARRSQVYTGLYLYEEDGTFKTLMDQVPLALEELMEKVNALGRTVLFLGDGVPPYKAQIQEQAKVPVQFAPPFMARQRAAAVAAYGKMCYEAGNFETAAAHRPDYLRQSSAERELAEKNEAGQKGTGCRFE